MKKTTAHVPALTTRWTGRVPFCTANTSVPDLDATPSPGSALQAATGRVRTCAATEITTRPGCNTATVRVWGGTTISIPEPAWCNGRHGVNHQHGEHPEDIAHASDETRIEINLPSGSREFILSGWLIQNPYSTDQTDTRAAICLPTGDCEDFDAADLDRLAAELRAAADYIEQLRQQLADATGETR